MPATMPATLTSAFGSCMTRMEKPSRLHMSISCFEVRTQSMPSRSCGVRPTTPCARCSSCATLPTARGLG